MMDCGVLTTDHAYIRPCLHQTKPWGKATATGPFTAAATLYSRFLILITDVSQSGIGISEKV
jgi:hypothetical protein